MFFKPPVRHALGAVFFDSSGYDATYFTVRVIVVPLFVQTDHVYFNVGKEIHSGSGYWKSTDPDLLDNLGRRIRQEALPLLASVDTYEGIADAALSLKKSGDPVVLRAIAIAHVMSGNTKLGLQELGVLISRLEGDSSASAYVQKLRRLRDLVVSDSEAAKRELLNDESESARALGLDKYR